MDRKAPVSDATISRNVSRQLASSGLRAPCHIQVQTRNGEVTLSGSVQFVHQRNTAVQAIRTVEGVTRVVEKLKVTPPAKHQYPQPARAPNKEPIGEGGQAVPHDAAAERDPLPAPVADAVPSAPVTDPMPVSGKEALQGRGVTAASPSAATVEGPDTVFSLQITSPQTSAAVNPAGKTGTRHTRSGDSYTFECSTGDEAERLRMLLASFADWLKKNSWVGNPKQVGQVHRVTFHAKSLLEFLRQQGF